MNIRSVGIVAFALLGAGLVGCGKRDLYFATSSNIGVDVAGDSVSPVQASFGFQRREIAQVPSSADGEAFPVYGNLDVDMKWFGERIVHQIFATGQAASNAAEAHVADEESIELEAEAKCVGRECVPLIFASHSIVGIHAGAGSAPQPASFSLGYKRVEATWIPTDSGAQQTRSVFGDISVSTCGLGECTSEAKAANVKPTATGGVRLSQTIATGAAAVTLTQRQETKDAITDATQAGIARAPAVAPESAALGVVASGER